jgi:hypothetical protein
MDDGTTQRLTYYKCEKHGVHEGALCAKCMEPALAKINDRLHAIPHIALSAGEEERYRAAEARFNEALNAPHFICRRCRRMTADIHHLCVPYGEGANWEERGLRWMVVGLIGSFVAVVLYLFIT